MSQNHSSPEVFIAGHARTAFGSFQGSLASVPTVKLGSIAIQGALKSAGLAADQIDEVILGNVLMAGEGQAPARQAMRLAGLPDQVPAMTINKVCGSGMKAILLAAQSIKLGDSEVVLAGGMENMSQAPYVVQGARAGFRMGHQQMLDSMIHDALWDPYYNQHMGNCGELCAKEKKITREDQDAFSVESFRRAQAAQRQGKFFNQIVPVVIPSKKGDSTSVTEDEGPSKVNFEKVPGLKPVFDKNGTITAANASTINDGACALVIAGAQAVKTHGLKPLARIVSYATHAQDPQWFTTAPIDAMRSAIKKAGWKTSDVDLFEVNEAFAVVAIAAARGLEISFDKINVWGGAISIGHPIGASGARIVQALVCALKDQGKKRGVAGICIGGGEATAIAVEISS